MMPRSSILNHVLATTLALLVIAAATLPSQHDTTLLFALFIPASLLFYMLVLRLLQAPNLNVTHWLIGALAIRCCLLFTTPHLSDDYFRFLWDGILQANGMNPFDLLPSDIITRSELPPGITKALYDQLNSPHYYTVYPPVSQLVFWLSVQAGNFMPAPSLLAIKAILFIAECFLILRIFPRLLTKLNLPQGFTFWYAFHPLVIIEIMGNVHFEGLTLTCFLAGLFLLYRADMWKSSFFLALSVATKLVPLIFFPALLISCKRSQSIRLLLSTSVILLVAFFPLLSSQFLPNFLSSIHLYFRNFEFNASIYYIVRWVGFKITGYNQIALIGPGLSLLSLLLILFLSLWPSMRRRFSLPERLLFASTIYLLFSTTVHPWYLIIPAGLAPLTRFTYPTIWALLGIFSYTHYAGGDTNEQWAWVILEYLLLALFITMDFKRISLNTHTA